MNYTVTIERSAQKDIAALSSVNRSRVLAAIQKLAGNPRPDGCIKLTGQISWRIRVGAIRVIYTIDDARLTVTIIEVGQRGGMYRT